MTPFLDGQLFETTFETSRGHVGLLAEVAIEGKTLHLRDVVIEPIAARKLIIETREILAARRQLMEMVRAAGFETLRITGQRLTGANVGKQVDLTVELSN